MILWHFLFISMALAQYSSVEEYCFSSAGKMIHTSQKLKFILVAADKIQEDERCFTVSTADHRRELIQNYIRRIDPTVQISFSSAELKREPCHIKVEKIKKNQIKSNTAGISTDTEVTAQTKLSNQTSTDTSTIQTLKDFELTVNQDTIRGECRFINSSLYEIKLEVAEEAMPLTPPVPAGTVVIIPNSEVPKIQQTSRLTTTLQLSRGQKMEIGSVVKQLRHDANKADINSGASADSSTDSVNEMVYLGLD